MRNGWEYKKLEEVCDFQGGSQPPKMEWSKEPQTGYVRMLQIRDFTQNATDYIEYVKESKSLKYCKEDDILIGRYGASVGKILTGLSGAYNVAIIKTIPIEIVNKNYIKYYFLSPQFQHNLLTVSQHRAAQAGFSKEDISDFIFPLPPLSEQERIVSELDLLTSIINKQKAQLKELDSLAQSIFYDMFGDPIENPKGWEIMKLEKIVSDDCSISYGIVQPGDGVENGVPVVRPIDLTKTFVSREGLKQTTKEISDSYKRTILKGDEILMCVRGTTGLLSLSSSNLKGCNVTRGITPIECNDKNNRLFVYYQLLSHGIQQHIENYTRGIALKQINMKDVRDIPLIVPPLSLQQSFASKIEAIEAQKALITKSMEETQWLFDSRMDYWFA